MLQFQVAQLSSTVSCDQEISSGFLSLAKETLRCFETLNSSRLLYKAAQDLENVVGLKVRVHCYFN